MKAVLLTLALCLVTASVRAQEPSEGSEPPACPEGHTCVPDEDMEVFVKLLRSKKCMGQEPPKFELDPIAIITDRQGRVYYSGSNPEPYRLRMTWCEYEVEAKAEVKTYVAVRKESTWGFRPRFKATFGVLLSEVVTGDKFTDSLDGGLLFEPFYVHWFNLNAYVGVRSFGAGAGFDITKNFGGYAGYALTWGGWRSNPFVSVFFSF